MKNELLVFLENQKLQGETANLRPAKAMHCSSQPQRATETAPVTLGGFGLSRIWLNVDPRTPR